MAGILNRALAISIGAMLLFLIASTLIMPQFSTAWRYCQAKQWNPDEGGALGANCTTPYTNANTSGVNGTSHTEDGITSPVETDTSVIEAVDYYCLNCETLGGYRTTIQGLLVLALSLAFVTFTIHFWPKGRGLG